MSRWSCNIDRRGRILRIAFGLLALGGGVWLLAATERDLAATGLCALGAFALFEGLKGWCALRAMGLKLPL